MFDKILIANRGEIACRIARTAQRMGISTVAIYSDADVNALHVAMCDEAYRVGESPPRESYLNGEAIIAIARKSGAQAIHPGYGFLSENASFAAACDGAGIVFAGPDARAIAAMASKSAAKRLMQNAGVPVVPGYHGDEQDETRLEDEAARIGYPVLIKPVAGGGGKGMRIVERSGHFAAALASAKREAKSSCGDDSVLLEKYLARTRHIEMQIFADTHGNVVHLFERDCSVQRRYQKVIEEAPAPGTTEERRQAMAEAAINAAKAVAYAGAGTIEFISEPNGTFYFMEMNTRLQVEHPVTEMITGLDLVEWQLRVAAGEPLPLRQHQLRIDGHAIEARIYAEEPERGFLPSIGKLVHLRAPAASEDIRIDTGVRQGDEITPYYDAMIAKLVTHGENRQAARSRMRDALAHYEIAGVGTNVAFLRRLAQHDAFVEAKIDTGFIARHHAELLPSTSAGSRRALVAAALAEALSIVDRVDAVANRSNDRYSPWNAVDAWWPNSTRHCLEFIFTDGQCRHEIALRKHGNAWRLALPESQEIEATVERRESQLSIVTSDEAFSATVIRIGDERHVFCCSDERRLVRIDPLAHAGESESHDGHLAAPMSGVVVAVHVKAGDDVRKGAPLMVLEAMKMEHTIAAPADGTVTTVKFAVGERVHEGADLVGIDFHRSAA